jgi:hypothetical protein
MSDIEGKVTRGRSEWVRAANEFQTPRTPGTTRGSRVGDGVLAIANFLPRSFIAEITEHTKTEPTLTLCTPCPSWSNLVPQRLFTVEQHSFTSVALSMMISQTSRAT